MNKEALSLSGKCFDRGSLEPGKNFVQQYALCTPDKTALFNDTMSTMLDALTLLGAQGEIQSEHSQVKAPPSHSRRGSTTTRPTRGSPTSSQRTETSPQSLRCTRSKSSLQTPAVSNGNSSSQSSNSNSRNQRFQRSMTPTWALIHPPWRMVSVELPSLVPRMCPQGCEIYISGNVRPFPYFPSYMIRYVYQFACLWFLIFRREN